MSFDSTIAINSVPSQCQSDICQSFFSALNVIVEEFHGSSVERLHSTRIAIMVVRIGSRSTSLGVQSNDGFPEELADGHAEVDGSGLDEVLGPLVAGREWHGSGVPPLGEADTGTCGLGVVCE